MLLARELPIKAFEVEGGLCGWIDEDETRDETRSPFQRPSFGLLVVMDDFS